MTRWSEFVREDLLLVPKSDPPRRVGFIRPQLRMSCQLYGTHEYIGPMLNATWSLLQACRLLSSCCLTGHRDAPSQQEQKHPRSPGDGFSTNELTVWHSKPPQKQNIITAPCFKRTHAVCQGENGAFLSPGARFCSHLTGCKSSLQIIVFIFFKTPSHESGPLMSTSEGKHPLWQSEGKDFSVI